MQIPEFRIERYFARHEFSAPYLLCCSDCEAVTVQEVLKQEPEAEKGLLELHLGYTESPGHPQLRQRIAALYDLIDPDQILVHTGAEEAIFTFMNATLHTGDHIIVHDPTYQSLFEIARGIGCEVTKWEAREEDGWELDLDFLAANIRRNTRAVALNCPNNPTGYLMSKEKLLAINELANEHDLLVFSDEVYRFLEYDAAARLPAMCDLNEQAVSLGVLSKSFGLPGLRIGWLATRNRELLRRIAAFKDYTTICGSAPSEYLAAVALRHKEHFVERSRTIIKKNLAEVNRFFENNADLFNWRPPTAGPIAFPALRGDWQAEIFCRELLEEVGVLLLPGTVYGDEYAKHFRIGFGRKNFGEGLQRLREFVGDALTK